MKQTVLQCIVPIVRRSINYHARHDLERTNEDKSLLPSITDRARLL